MRMLIAVSVIGVGVLLPVAQPLARTDVCRHASQKDIAALFDRWNASLQTGDPDKVVANYAARSILLPTVSNEPRLTPEAKRAYFVPFLRKKPVGRIDTSWIEVDCNTAIDAGSIRSLSATDLSCMRAIRSPIAGMAGDGPSRVTTRPPCPSRSE